MFKRGDKVAVNLSALAAGRDLYAGAVGEVRKVFTCGAGTVVGVYFEHLGYESSFNASSLILVAEETIIFPTESETAEDYTRKGLEPIDLGVIEVPILVTFFGETREIKVKFRLTATPFGKEVIEIPIPPASKRCVQ